MKNWYVYIMTNRKNWVLYIWVTSNLPKRVFEHKNSIAPNSFTSKYRCKQLVYFEVFDAIDIAIEREKQLKNWKREWKIALIEKDNPLWNDLYNDIIW